MRLSSANRWLTGSSSRTCSTKSPVTVYAAPMTDADGNRRALEAEIAKDLDEMEAML
jgi:hypothetical protein